MERDPATGQWTKEPIFDEEWDDLDNQIDKMSAVYQHKQTEADNAQQTQFTGHILQKTCEAAGINSPQELDALKYSDRAKYNALIGSFHENAAATYKNIAEKASKGSPASPQKTEKQAVSPQGGLGFVARHPAKAPEEIAVLKEKGRNEQLSDEELVDILGAALK